MKPDESPETLVTGRAPPTGVPSNRMNQHEPAETLRVRISGPPDAPALVYLPGIHGDWTLVTPFRLLASRTIRLVEFTYPRNPDWSLPDYAENILAALARQNITRGWLLAESFGSQVAWAIHDRLHHGPQPPSLQVEGTILAGGFAAYPAKPPARWLVSWRLRHPGRGSGCLVRLYLLLLRLRFGRAPESRLAADEFIARRRAPHDAEAILSRIRLLIAFDPASIIAAIQTPVFYLSGLVDPIVPWFLAGPGLRRVSPSYAGGKIVPAGDHNVLGTAPAASVRQILQWMKF